MDVWCFLERMKSDLNWYAEMVWSCDEESDEYWVKKCMEYRVEGRRPVGRPRGTWWESVEADMAELEIGSEDVNDRKKWRKNAMKRKSNPIGNGI